MTEDDLGTDEARLTAERASLIERLRSLEDDVHSHQSRDKSAHADRIDSMEKEIRKIVLRLVEIEREEIELRIAASL